MSRFLGIFSVVLVVVLAMVFAAANAGHRVTLNLGILTLYRAPVTLVAFGGLLVGMLVMFATGIYTDLKVRKILRDRLAEESRQEQVWIDRNQRDLFAQEETTPAGAGVDEAAQPDASRDDGSLARIPMDTPQPAEPILSEDSQPKPMDLQPHDSGKGEALTRIPMDTPQPAEPILSEDNQPTPMHLQRSDSGGVAHSAPDRTREEDLSAVEEPKSPAPGEDDGPESSDEEDFTRP